MPRRPKGTNNSRKNNTHKSSFKEKMSEVLELPKELTLDIPRITLVGNRQLFLENYKGIIEYEDFKIRVRTNEGIIKLDGCNMIIKEITSEDIMISGEINSIEFQH